MCDQDTARAAKVARAYEIGSTYQNYVDLLERETLDLVTVCTPPSTHRRIVTTALESGAHVMCEKPLATNLVDARAMVRAAEDAKGFLAVGFNHRYMSACQAVHDFVESGALGRPVCARASMLETHIPAWGQHHVRGISGGGAVASTGVHMLDLLMWLVGNPQPLTATASMATIFPRKRAYQIPDAAAAASYNVEDIAFGHIRFDSGFWLTIESSWVWDEPGWEARFVLVGDRAQANVGPLAFWAELDGKPTEVTRKATGDLDVALSMQRQFADLRDAIRCRRQPLIQAVQTLPVQAVVDAMYLSAATGCEVAVEPTS